ncbi:MAG: HAD-IIIC family phosphatase [Magnetococcales bacterium]|nr:HAD-IIIC family phosphatase [Magnetococcales bacterium]NGZ25650.1 HAD-IIIC family phosphatase [Magnetococcales bacterium]
MSTDLLKKLLLDRNPEFWPALSVAVDRCGQWADALRLAGLARKAAQTLKQPQPGQPLRVALLGGYTTQPFAEVVELLLVHAGFAPELVLGSFDNHVAELLGEGSTLLKPPPQVCVVMPSQQAGRCPCSLSAPREQVEGVAVEMAHNLLSLCKQAHLLRTSDLILANFSLPSLYDPGMLRSKIAATPWNFTKRLNMELGLAAPPWLTIWDWEFISCQVGLDNSWDARSHFASRQPGSPAFQWTAAKELVHLIRQLRGVAKKVLVCDLDNTLWGGIIGDDGVEHIELGPPSPRGEAFLAFQRYIKQLSSRGVVLAVCSKNQDENARIPFIQHPHMALKLEDFASFKANWQPKPDNLYAIAAELNLGLDSMVFIDDSPAEIHQVRQFLPQVTTLLLGPDPSDYVMQLDSLRSFEPLALTAEDFTRADLYSRQVQYEQWRLSFTDLNSYLSSLEMQATISKFNETDLNRITQLINKSNQFNLTTQRRTMAQVSDLIHDPQVCAFTVRLRDRHGDHGLIGVLVAFQEQDNLAVDTWLMSCRVLSRQVEDLVQNHLVRCARTRGCGTITASYLVSKKNGLVVHLLDNLGYDLITTDPCGDRYYRMEVASFQERPTHIQVTLQEENQ